MSRGPVRISGPSWKRRALQLASLAFFVLLFAFTLFPARDWLPPPDILLRINPLAALGALLATRGAVYRMLFAVPLVVLTLIAGRFFCGYICPTGTTLDLWRRYILRRHRDGVEKRDFTRWKYHILILVITSSAFGISLVWFLDPLAIFVRFLTLAVYPIAVFVGDGTLSLISPVAERLGMISVAYRAIFRPSFQGAIPVLVVFGGILVLELAQRRFWCRNLCPLGALLALLARFSLFRRHVSDDCTECGECEEVCPMGAIDEGGRGNLVSECIGCYTCASACPAGEVTINTSKPTSSGKPDLERRRVLGSIALGFGAASIFRMDALRVSRSHNFVRPPGSVPETELLSRCYRCGECMKVCVTGGIQPAVLEAGVSGLWTPILATRIGGCEKTCNMCGRVCPSGAIRSLSLTEKTFVKMGTASIDRFRCIAWEQQKLCLICDEICPFAAIDFKLVTDAEGESKRPFINEEVCTGCGLCEMKCPVEGRSAIVVGPTGEERFLSGGYLTQQKVEARRRAIEGRTPIETLKEEERLLPRGFIIE